MEKDDYHVLVYKILVYLYAMVRGKAGESQAEYLISSSIDFPICEEYFTYIFEKLQENGMIERASFVKTLDGDIVSMDLSRIRITPEGIAYLKENSLMQKAASFLSGAWQSARLIDPI